MNRLKINILTPIPFWHPGTAELITGLRNEGLEVVALDIWEFLYYDENGEIHNLVPYIFKGFAKKVYRRLFRKRIIRKYIGKDDVIDIQWCGFYYARYMKFLSRHNDKIIATPFGSDVLRANTSEKLIQKEIFDNSKAIVLGKNWTSEFLSYFPGNEDKIHNNQFGSARYDFIMGMWSEDTKQSLREKYNIPEDKIVVTVGYSANPVQQHILFLDILEGVDSDIRHKLVLLFPLTYGIDKKSDYYQTLKNRIVSSDFDYILFENRLSDIELCESRIISDIMVNLQSTDTQASSIKEAFAARNVVLAGDWLPYGFYSDFDVLFFSSSLDSFPEKFVSIVDNLELHKLKISGGSDSLNKFASWKSIIPEFINVYNSIR